MKRITIFSGVLTFILTLFSYSQVQIVNNSPNNQWASKTDGDYIVWLDEQESSPQVYLYQITFGTTQKITTDNNEKYSPYISDGVILWEEKVNDQIDIYYYEISHPEYGIRLLLNWEKDQFILSFKNNRLLFRDFGCSDLGCLYYYNLITHEVIRITGPENGSVTEASIDGNLAAYVMNDDLYLYNIYNGHIIRITNDEIEQKYPSVSGFKICWENYDYTNCDLYIFDYQQYLNFHKVFTYNISEKFIEKDQSHPSNQRYPSIDGNKITFCDDRTGTYGIYLYSMTGSAAGTVTEIYTSDYDNLYPVINGDHICWWDNKVYGLPLNNADVYLWKRPFGSDLAVTINTAKVGYQLNEEVVINVMVSNIGGFSTSNIILTDSISTKLQIISVTSTAGSVSYVNNIVTCKIANLNPDNSVTVIITTKARSTGIAEQIASVASEGTDVVPQNNIFIKNIKILKIRNTKILNVSGVAPKIKVDQNGFVHIVLITKNNQRLTYVTNKTGTWTEEVIFNAGAQFITDIDMDLDNEGRIHVCAVSLAMDSPDQMLHYIYYDYGRWWSTFPLNASSVSIVTPKIKIDKHNYVNIGYMTSRFGGEIYYLYKKTGTWMGPELICGSYNSMSMDLDTNGYVHFVTYDINQGPIYITNAPDGQWKDPELVEEGWSGGQLESLSLDIEIDGSNTPHISYVGKHTNNEDYKYAVKRTNVWENYYVDAGSYMGGYNCLTVDKNTKPFIMYADPNQSELRYAEKDNNIFNNFPIQSNYYDFWIGNIDITSDVQNNLHYVFIYQNKLYYGTNAEFTVNFGGGDEMTGGYFFANSITSGENAPSKPTYNWIDPVSNGHKQIINWTSGNANDGFLGPISLPFNFEYFANIYDSIYVNSNGYLSFSKGYPETGTNTIIPFIDEPNNILAACVMDLNLDTLIHNDAKIYYGGDNNKFVVTYYHAYVNNNLNEYITFQIVLYPNGNILYQYNSQESWYPLPPSIAEDALIGIENEMGTKGICYRNNGAGGPIFGSPLAVMFGPNALVLPVEEHPVHLPDNYSLAQNYPNPFNPSTTIMYSVPERSVVTIKIYNVLGEEITTLVNEEKERGWYEIKFNSNGLASGIYVCRMQAGNYVSIKKMMLLK
jgi:uncharacterized repeat protein (TIGR01451 family)